MTQTFFPVHDHGMTAPIYLDHNATTPVDPRVADAMAPYLHGTFGNPSSNHRLGVRARLAVDTARGHVAELLGCEDWMSIC